MFCGFDRNDKWDYEFWVQDIFDIWCNQPSFFKKKSLLEFASFGKAESVSRLRHINNFLKDNPRFEEYINMKWM